ncbi:MAG TPA: hypothetical protein DCF89_03875 [Flavobacteriales bacterium]|nr:hypothetical protein [Crocinitomicaceae bacterium]HAE30231.1 hypothetical protein [Flavobacteriales bacterium]
MNKEDLKYLERIRAGSEESLVDLYRKYRDNFVTWSQTQFSVSEEQAKDIFQETMIDFYQNTVSGQLDQLTCSLKTYLFQIAKFKLINLLNKDSRTTYLSDLNLINSESQIYTMDNESDFNSDQINEALSKLPEDCQKVLRLYYHNEYDMTSIARELNYKNANTAKSKKSLCMQKLIRELAKMSKILVL